MLLWARNTKYLDAPQTDAMAEICAIWVFPTEIRLDLVKNLKKKILGDGLCVISE